MTVIVYRDGVLASDSQVSLGDTYVGSCEKIKKTKDGWLAGASGRISSISVFLEWAEERNNEIELKDFNGFLISPEGEVFLVDDDVVLFKVKAPFHAEGAGHEIALGALYMGATAIEAVQAAIKYHNECGGEIQVVKL